MRFAVLYPILRKMNQQSKICAHSLFLIQSISLLLQQNYQILLFLL